MIADLKPYPAYKDSGVEWLGDVPEHWEVRRGKALFRCIDVRSSTGEEELLTVSSKNGVVPRSSAKVTMFKAESYKGYKLCWPGDLVINSLWAWGCGLGVSRHHGIVSSAYGVYRLIPTYTNYSAYIDKLVRSTSFNWELYVRSKGVWISRLLLTDEAFLGAPFPLPPLSEQIAIVRFLDFADNRIRRSIHAKQKLIKLLEEEKQAVIHHVVTRGLDPDVPLKPSGVEWLGNVPENWNISSMGMITESIQTGPFGSQIHANEYVTGGIPIINPSHMCGGCIEPNPTVTVSQKKALELSRHELRAGDLIVARRGELGRCALVKETESGWLCGTGSLRIRPKTRVLEPAYLCLVFGSQGICDTLTLSSIGATMDNLNASMVADLRLPCPPLSEQRLITEFVTLSSIQIQSAADLIQHEIALLHEYRTRLIADVVTGKLDVREAAALLPQEMEEMDLLCGVESLSSLDGGLDEDLAETPENEI